MCAHDVLLCVFFFFSSRRRHTRFKCDWSSDVCSSDLSPLSSSCRDPPVPRQEELSGERRVSAGKKPTPLAFEIGRGAGRGKGEISVVAVSLKKKKKENKEGHNTMRNKIYIEN